MSPGFTTLTEKMGSIVSPSTGQISRSLQLPNMFSFDKPTCVTRPDGSQEILFKLPLKGKSPKKPLLELDLHVNDPPRGHISNPAFNKRYEYYHFSDDNSPTAVKPPLPTKTKPVIVPKPVPLEVQT